MGFGAVLGLWAATYVASRIYRAATEEHNIEADRYWSAQAFPKAEEGARLPLLYGRNRVTPHLVWYGGLQSQPVKEPQFSEQFSTTPQITVAHTYFASMTFAVGIGQALGRKFTRVWMADKEIWSGSATVDGADHSVNKPTLWGGRGAGGGVIGTLNFYMGGFFHPLNSAMAVLTGEGANLPRFNGTAYCYFKGMGLGESPQVPSVSIEYENIPDALGASATVDCNPADILYDLLTQEWGRVAPIVTSSDIDLASFQAAASTLDTEGHGMSMAFTGTVGEAIRQVIDQIDGVLYEDASSGKIALKLIRNDYTPGSLLHLQPGDWTKVRAWSTGDWDDTYNVVIVEYEDRAYDYKKRPYRDVSDASVNLRGERAITVKYPGCKTRSLARKLANRDLLALSVPNIHLELEVDRQASGLNIGDVFRFSWPDQSISQMVFRVEDRDLGAKGDGRVVIRASRDKYDRQSPFQDIDPVPEWDPPNVQPAAATVWRADEVPLWIGYKAELADKIADRYASHMMYAAKVPGSIEQFYGADASEDAGVTYARDVNFLDFKPYAEVETAYDRTNEPYDTTTGLRIDTLDFTAADVLGSATADEIRNEGKNLFLLGDEICAYESYTDLTGGVYRLNNVWRGLLDTVPVTHAVNTKVWFGISLNDIGLFRWDGDETIRNRIITSTGLQNLDPASAGTADTTLVDRALLAYPPADMHADSSKGGFTFYENEILVDWRARNRLETVISRGDEASEHGTGGIDSTTRYDIDGRIGAGGWTELLADQDPTDPTAGVTVPLQLIGAGTAQLRIVAERDVNDDSLVVDYRDAYQAPVVEFSLPEYRQLLRNPGFDNATNGEFWSVDAGGAVWNTSASEVVGGVGKSFRGANGSGGTISQIVDVSALSPVGGDVLLIWHETTLSSDADDTLNITITALDASESSLGTATTGAFHPTAGVWHDNALAYNNLPANTAKLKVTIVSAIVGGGDATADATIDRLGLYFASPSPISALQLTDEDFETGGTWSVDSGTWDDNYGSDAVTGSACARCTATGVLSQTVSVGSYVSGDVAWVSGWIKGVAGGVANLYIETQDSGFSTIEEIGVADSSGSWVWVNLYIALDGSTANIKVRCEGTAGGGQEARFDNILLRFIDQT